MSTPSVPSIPPASSTLSASSAPSAPSAPSMSPATVIPSAVSVATPVSTAPVPPSAASAIAATPASSTATPASSTATPSSAAPTATATATPAPGVPGGVPGGAPGAPDKPALIPYRRPRREPTLFHKKPYRPIFCPAEPAGIHGPPPEIRKQAWPMFPLPSELKGPKGPVIGALSASGKVNADVIAPPSMAMPRPMPKYIPLPSNIGPRKAPAANPASAAATGPTATGVTTGAVTGATAGATNGATNGATTGATPQLGYKDYKLMSCNRHGWLYDVMKFDSYKKVDILEWEGPVKLNRKELRRPDPPAEPEQKPVGPMLGPDGKPVIGADGKVVMVDAEGKPIQESRASKDAKEKEKEKQKEKEKEEKRKKRRFQKKTRQVFLVPEAVRKLRREERYPWVMEDKSGKEVWVGRMEDANKCDLHALFMPANEDYFKFVPGHRWYKFQKKRPWDQCWDLAEAERMMAERSKKNNMERFMMRVRNNMENATGPNLMHDYGNSPSLGPGGRKLVTVVRAARFDDDEDDEDEGGSNKRRRREEEDGDLDEMEYEEEFQDDDEYVIEDGEKDEEAKEIEQRLKREYRAANKMREGYIDESDSEDDGEQLTGEGKAMKKLMRKFEKNHHYDEDSDDKNPYLSTEDEESSEEEVIPEPEPVPQPQPQPKASTSQAKAGPSQTKAGASQAKASATQAKASTSQAKGSTGPAKGAGATQASPARPTARIPSRTGSPAPGHTMTQIKSEGSPIPSLGMGGHSVLAKRATSPKAPGLLPKPRIPPGMAGRATSPLAASTASRATSPVLPTPLSSVTATAASKKRKAEDALSMAGRATSPVAPGAASRATSPVLPSAAMKKRKTEDAPPPTVPGRASTSAATTTATATTKKRKAEDTPPPSVQPGQAGSSAATAAAAAAGPKIKKRKSAVGAAVPVASASTSTATPMDKASTPPAASPTQAKPAATVAPSPAPAPAAAPVPAITLIPGFPIITAQTKLTRALLVQWLRLRPGAKTRECIQYFQPCLNEERTKTRFTAWVKEVASLKNAVLVLKKEYRDDDGEA